MTKMKTPLGKTVMVPQRKVERNLLLGFSITVPKIKKQDHDETVSNEENE